MPRDGRYIEEVGRYNPLTNPKVIDINLEKVDEWISKCAQPTNAVSHLIDVARSGEVITEKKAKMSKKAAAKAAAAAEAAAGIAPPGLPTPSSCVVVGWRPRVAASSGAEAEEMPSDKVADLVGHRLRSCRRRVSRLP